MTELIKIEINKNQEPVVSGRELHKVLKVETPYRIWFPRMCEYGFTENVDYISLEQNCTKPKGGRPEVNHAIKLDMAKEIAMLQRNENGKKVRQYFIQVEKEFNSPEKIMARALKIAEGRLNILQLENSQQKQIIGELKPKADYTDKILKNKTTMTVTAIAKDYGMGATTFNKILHDLKIQYKQSGQWLLYQKYQACGYTHSKTTEYTRKDGSTGSKLNTEWTQKRKIIPLQQIKRKQYHSYYREGGVKWHKNECLVI